MKIKGKLLLKEGLLKTVIGELVYISQESISIYDNGLYLNISDVFFREKIDPFIIPIKRVGSGEEDFEIDMTDARVIHVIIIDEPQKKYGWIGPFSFEFEHYTKERFWKRLNCIDLLNLLYQSSVDGNDEESSVIAAIRKKKFIMEVDLFDEEKLNKEIDVIKKYLFEIVKVLEKMEEEGNYPKAELSAQKLLISESENDIFVLNEKLEKLEVEKKNVLFEKLTLNEHITALNEMDLSAQDADYRLAAKHKKRIDELQNKKLVN